MSKRTFRLDKLVRDGVFESMQSLGQEVNSRNLTAAELIKAADDKLAEETFEFIEGENGIDGLADVLEAVRNAGEVRGHSFDELLAAQTNKRQRVGGFSAGIYVETLTVNDGDPWGDYYAARPDRFPEITEFGNGQ